MIIIACSIAAYCAAILICLLLIHQQLKSEARALWAIAALAVSSVKPEAKPELAQEVTRIINPHLNGQTVIHLPDILKPYDDVG
jgi:hypothetical protein